MKNSKISGLRNNSDARAQILPYCTYLSGCLNGLCKPVLETERKLFKNSVVSSTLVSDTCMNISPFNGSGNEISCDDRFHSPLTIQRS